MTLSRVGAITLDVGENSIYTSSIDKGRRR